MTRNILKSTFLFLVVLGAGGLFSPLAIASDNKHKEEASPVTVSDAVIFAVRPSSPAAAAFLTLNSTVKTRLTDADSSIARTVMIHETVVDDQGVARMQHVDGVDIIPGQETVLKRGGLHVMFMGLKTPLKTGDEYPVTLTFADGHSLTIDIPVKIGR